MDGLTAKVFRTYNASITLQAQLKELTSGKCSAAQRSGHPLQMTFDPLHLTHNPPTLHFLDCDSQVTDLNSSLPSYQLPVPYQFMLSKLPSGLIIKNVTVTLPLHLCHFSSLVKLKICLEFLLFSLIALFLQMTF